MSKFRRLAVNQQHIEKSTINMVVQPTDPVPMEPARDTKPDTSSPPPERQDI